MATRKGLIPILKRACDKHDKPLTEALVDAWLDDLDDIPDEVIAQALRRHSSDPDRGRFFPKPSDVMAQLADASAADGRPTADEAWAMLPFDEAQSVVWTDEMAQAWGVAAPCMPDKIAARMAFRAAYERMVAEARRSGLRVQWTASLGTDKEARREALERAVRAGRITQHHADGLLPAPDQSPAQTVRLLERSTQADSDIARKALADMRRMLGIER